MTAPTSTSSLPVPLSAEQEARITTASKLYLDAAASRLKPGTVYRLAQARRSALAALEARTASANFGHTLAMNVGDRIADRRFWLAGLAVALAMGVLGVVHWQSQSQSRENAEIDALILGSDVPMDAFFDKGFKQWVKDAK